MPCKHAVQLARAEVRQNMEASPELIEFSEISLENAEVGTHKFFRKYGLCLDLPIESTYLGQSADLRNFPYVKFSSWVQFLLDSGRLTKQLVGCSSIRKMRAVLKEFWSRYQDLDNEHPVFRLAQEGQLDLEFTIPCFSHSDEGRSYKKEALWMISIHGVLGRGTRKYLELGRHKVPVSRNQFGLNFLGHTLSTQFLFCTMLRETANQNPGAMNTLLTLFAEDLADLACHGITSTDGATKVWIIHMATKGDLPALNKLGSFTRTFGHVPRAPRSRKPCQGVCHQCLAGQEENVALGLSAYPFEDLSSRPIWEGTIGATLPWAREPAILKDQPISRANPAKFFAFDLWHICHLGVAKHYIASSFVVLVESGLMCFRGMTSIETKFNFITQEYQDFCKQSKFGMWVREINRETLQWPQSSTCPIGRWNKGSASTTLMLFLHHFCARHVVGKTEDEMLLLIVPLDTFRRFSRFKWSWCFVSIFSLVVYMHFSASFNLPLRQVQFPL